MSTRALIIGTFVVLILAAAAAWLLRSSGPSDERMTINGEALTGGPAPDSVADTFPDPTEEYIRTIGPPDTSGLELLHEDAAAESAALLPLPGPPIGAAAPAFALPNVEGGMFRLSETRGRVALLNFWATWCEPCRDEIPGLIMLQEELGGDGLRVVGISVEDDGLESVEAFTPAFPFNYPLLVEGRSVAEEYGAHVAVPTTVIVDRQGRIAARLYGALERDSLAAHVRPLLARR